MDQDNFISISIYILNSSTRRSCSTRSWRAGATQRRALPGRHARRRRARGGHLEASAPDGRLLGIDADPAALAAAGRAAGSFRRARLDLAHGNFRDIAGWRASTASTASMGCCSTSASRRTSSTRRSAGSHSWPTRRWICGSTRPAARRPPTW